MLDPRKTEKIMFTLFGLATAIVILPVIIICAFIFIQGLPGISLQFLLDIPRHGMKGGGIAPAIVGTIYLTLATAVFSIPLGVFAAVYLTEYAGEHFLKRLIEISIVNLAGVPSIVFGLFGLGLFVIFLGFGPSILAGALTLAVMTIPVIITASREALTSVPKTYREVSLSLGATKWQTIRHIVLPNAAPGIITGAILGLSRAAGETAPILFTVAAFYLPYFPNSVFDQAMVLPYHIYVLATQVPGVSPKIQYGTVLVLVGLILIMNFSAAYLRAKFRKRKTW
ncbi:MAG: phosphate ABC transporter permease PstA [Candidatus Saganbacteria bacterium]|nr:phosphate ABC transporter permease PstA [Candidatus Saganbacteria bacterium]